MDRLHGLAFRGVPATEVWERARTRGRGAVVGHKGSGKTTLLLEVAKLVEGPVWIQLRRDARALTAAHRGRIEQLTAGDVVFVDGADLLPYFDRRWLSKRTREVTLLGTLHTPGWLPTLATLTTSPALLTELVRELCDAPIDCEALFHQHRGNLRDALRDLYDRAAG